MLLLCLLFTPILGIILIVTVFLIFYPNNLPIICDYIKKFFFNLTFKHIGLNLLIRTVTLIILLILQFMGIPRYLIFFIRVLFLYIIFSSLVKWYSKEIFYFFENTPWGQIKKILIFSGMAILFYFIISLYIVFISANLIVIFFPEFTNAIMVNDPELMRCHMTDLERTRYLKLRNSLVWDPNKLYTPDDNVPNSTMPYWNEGYNPNSLGRIKALFNNSPDQTGLFFITGDKKDFYFKEQFHNEPLQLFKESQGGLEFVKTVPANPWPAKLLSGSGQEELYAEVPLHKQRHNGVKYQLYKPFHRYQQGWPLFVRVPNQYTGVWWMCSINRIVPEHYRLEITLTEWSGKANKGTYQQGEWFNYPGKIALAAKQQELAQEAEANRHRRSKSPSLEDLRLKSSSLIDLRSKSPSLIDLRSKSPSLQDQVQDLSSRNSSVENQVQDLSSRGSEVLQGVQEGNTRTPQSPGLLEQADNIRARSVETEQTTETRSSSRETTSKRSRSPELDQATTTEQPPIKRTRPLTLDEMLNPKK